MFQPLACSDESLEARQGERQKGSGSAALYTVMTLMDATFSYSEPTGTRSALARPIGAGFVRVVFARLVLPGWLCQGGKPITRVVAVYLTHNHW